LQEQSGRYSAGDARTLLTLVGQVEREGQGIAARFAGGAGVSGQFRDFQVFIEQLDHHQLFINMVETRLQGCAPDMQQQQGQHLTEMRWSIMQIEIEATNKFLARMAAGNMPWPMGSQPFLRRRLKRMDEIADFHAELGEACKLAAPDVQAMRKVRDQVGEQIGKSVLLVDFSIPDPTWDPAPLEAKPSSAEAQRPAAKQKAKAPAKAAAKAAPAPKRVMRLQTREADGYYYIIEDGFGVVSDACRINDVSLDDLSKGLDISRPGLVLVLNGRDPVDPGLLKSLRRFVARAGGPIDF
jgi:hypothetical protein